MPRKEPNWCSYEMRVRGDREAVDEMCRRMGDMGHRPHFWFVSDAEKTVTEHDGMVVAEFAGRCPWSIRCCMLDGEYTYADARASDGEATSLGATARELGLDVEVFSCEPRMGFAEHYLYGADGTAIEETTDYKEVPWFRDTYPTFAELDEEYGLTERGVTEDDFGGGDRAVIGGYGRDWAF